MSERVECLVIGAGVVGLAVARELAAAGREVIVVEAADRIGTGVSSRHSEVIHAGLYYAPGSLKARLCVEGRERLYAFCRSRGVGHRQTGKLIVATDPTQHPALERIAARAAANGVTDLRWLEPGEATALEPALRCTGALLSPSTGIVDSHGVMDALHAEALDAGAMFAFETPVVGGEVAGDGIAVRTGGDEPMELHCSAVVNAAGLGAQSVARSIRGVPESTVPTLYMAKGNYFALRGRAPFGHLIYPAPESAGLGVHLTLDLAGQARFGPDVQWVDTEDYDVDPGRAAAFYAGVRRWWPDLEDGSLIPAYSGIRPKLQAPGEPRADFAILGPADHGVAGLVNLFGIESPGFTAALAIAPRVAGLATG